MKKALLFDFDGVLVSSEKPRFQVLQQCALHNNIAIADDAIRKMVGRPTLKFLNDIIAESDKHRIPTIIWEYEKEYKGNLTKYVEPIGMTVDFVKGYTGNLMFALVSMSPRSMIEELTKHFGIYTKFKTIISREDVVHHKPDPEIYLKAAKELGVEPRECSVIEDTIIGMQSAINARMDCYVLLNGFNNKQEFATFPVVGFIGTQAELAKIA